MEVGGNQVHADVPVVAAIEIELSWDPARLDLDRVHAALASTYWSPRVRRDIVERAVANSLCVGAYDRATGAQVGFARLITDRTTFAYLCDVVVFDGYRGQGIGKRLVRETLAHPELQTIRRCALVTRDAQELYARHGYQPVVPGRWMERMGPNEFWQEPPEAEGG